MVNKELREARAQLRVVLERIRVEAVKIANRAAMAAGDVRNGKLTFHESVRVEALLTESERVLPLEDRLRDLSRELEAVR